MPPLLSTDLIDISFLDLSLFSLRGRGCGGTGLCYEF